MKKSKKILLTQVSTILLMLTVLLVAGSSDARSNKIPYEYTYFWSTSYNEVQEMMPAYSAVAAQVEQLKQKGTEATLIRAGKPKSFDPATLQDVLKSAKDGDVIRLGKGSYTLYGELNKKTVFASGITIEGSLFETMLTVRDVEFKATRLVNLSLVSPKITVVAPHRLWLENVRVIRSYDNLTVYQAIFPKGSSVVSVLGGFILEPYQCHGGLGDYNWDICTKKNEGFRYYLEYSYGTISINSMELSPFSTSAELKPFFTEYAKYLTGGEKPKKENALRAHKFLRGILDSGILSKAQHYGLNAAETAEKNQLWAATYVRLTSLLESEFGALGPVAPPEVIRQTFKLAESHLKNDRPLSALYHLQVLSSQNIPAAERKTLQSQVVKARTTLAQRYGTAIDYQLTGTHKEPEGLMHKSTKEQVESRNRSALLRTVTERFPIAQIADEVSARFKVSIRQTKSEFTSALSSKKIEERKMLIEDPSARAARQKAAGEAAWAKFQSAMSNIDATASAMERTARTNYEQRVRVEDAGSGKQLVWYDNKKNQEALNLSNPSLSYEPAPAGMLEVTATTKRYLYNNMVNVSYTAVMTDKGKAIDKLPAFSKTQSWNFSCKTEKTPNDIGVMMEDSNCFGGTGGRSDEDINLTVMREVFAKWIHSHYESRVMAENIHRLAGASKSKDKTEMAEMILLGRSLGIASSKEQEMILKEVFGDVSAFDKVLALAAVQ